MRTPNAATIELIKGGRTIVGPFNVGRAVRMWNAHKLAAHQTIAGYSTWEVYQIRPDGERANDVVWLLSVRPDGSQTLYQE